MSEGDAKYKLAIVMPVRNEEKYLGQTLDQIYLQDFPMDKLEVVISEGGSTDRTREIAESYRNRFGSLKVLDNPRQLPSSGRNVGIKNSTAPYILILDGHTFIPSKNFLKDIVEIFEKKTNKTPKSIIDVCKQRIKRYETDVKKGKKEK